MYVWHSNLRGLPAAFPLETGLLCLFFILMVVFLISNTMISLPGITVELPHMDDVKITATDKLVVTVTKDSEIFFNGSKVNYETLRSQLYDRAQAAHLVNPGSRNPRPEDRKDSPDLQPKIVVCADKNISLTAWCRIASIARELNLNIYLVTEPTAAGPAAIPATSNVRSDDPI